MRPSNISKAAQMKGEARRGPAVSPRHVWACLLALLIALFMGEAFAFTSGGNHASNLATLQSYATNGYPPGFTEAAGYIKTVEGGGSGASSVGGDYHYLENGKYVITKNAAGENSGRASDCGGRPDCLPMSWGSNQNRMTIRDTADQAYNLMYGSKMPDSVYNDPKQLSEFGKTFAQSPYGDQFSNARIANNIKNAIEYLQYTGEPMTPENLARAAEAFNFSDCDVVSQMKAGKGCGRCGSWCKKWEEQKGKPVKITVSPDGKTIRAQLMNEDGTPIGAPVIIHCPNLELSDALKKAAIYYLTSNITRGTESFADGVKEEASSDRSNYLAPLRLKYCMDIVTGKYFDILGQLLSGAKMIEMMIKAMIDALLNQVCQNIATTINNVLSSVCIPLPQLPGLPSLGAVEAKSCDGVSLNTLIGVSQVGSSSEDLARALTGTTYTPYLPSTAIENMIREIKKPKASTSTSSRNAN